MIKNIIFDFDGTIANTEELAYHIYEKIVSENEILKLTKEEFEELKKVSMFEKFKRHKVSIFKLPKLARRTMRLIGEVMDDINPYDGMIETLTLLHNKGYRLFIVSSNSKKNINKFLKRFDLDIFTAIYGKAKYFGKEKVLKKVMAKYDLTHDSTLYIGDEVRDVVSCNNVGMPILSVSWGFDDPEFLIEQNKGSVIDTVEELQSLLLV